MFSAKQAEVPKERLSTTWHNMKQRFKYLFCAEHHFHVEAWYNQVATHKQRDMFRDIIKQLHLHDDQDEGSDAVQCYRATHMMTMYHVLLTDSGRAKTRSWLSRASASDLDKFREVFAAVQGTLQPESSSKTQFQYRPLHDPLAKGAFRKKIDWESSKTADLVRSTATNPMDTRKGPQADVGGAGKTAKKMDRGSAAAASIMKILKVDARDLQKMKENQSQELDNFYEVDPEGVTVFKTKQAAKSTQAKGKVTVIPTLGGAKEWKTTNREWHNNKGAQKPEKVNPEEHPALALTTASLGFCLPNLSPKRTNQSAKREERQAMNQ